MVHEVIIFPFPSSGPTAAAAAAGPPPPPPPPAPPHIGVWREAGGRVLPHFTIHMRSAARAAGSSQLSPGTLPWTLRGARAREVVHAYSSES